MPLPMPHMPPPAQYPAQRAPAIGHHPELPNDVQDLILTAADFQQSMWNGGWLMHASMVPPPPPPQQQQQPPPPPPPPPPQPPPPTPLQSPQPPRPPQPPQPVPAAVGADSEAEAGVAGGGDGAIGAGVGSSGPGVSQAGWSEMATSEC